MANKYYKTERDITALKKEIKYVSVPKADELEIALEDLLGGKYNSVIAEKKRSLRYSFSKKLFKTQEKAKKLFEDLTTTITKSHKIDLNYSEIEASDFVVNDDKNSYKLELIKIDDINEYYYSLTYILNDVVYVDEIWLYDKKNGKYKLTVTKNMTLPFTQDMLSQHTWTSNWFNKKRFKEFKKEILRGLY